MSAEHLTICPECKHGSYERQISRPHSDMIEFHTPIHLHSIGCTSVEQIREMQRAGVSISDDPNHPDFGIPIAHTRKEKLTALKTAGYVERK